MRKRELGGYVCVCKSPLGEAHTPRPVWNGSRDGSAALALPPRPLVTPPAPLLPQIFFRIHSRATRTLGSHTSPLVNAVFIARACVVLTERPSVATAPPCPHAVSLPHPVLSHWECGCSHGNAVLAAHRLCEVSCLWLPLVWSGPSPSFSPACFLLLLQSTRNCDVSGTGAAACGG